MIKTEQPIQERKVNAMSDREQAKQIIDLLLFLRGMLFDDDLEDDRYCERLVENYLNDPSPDKHETIPIEELAKREGIEL